MSAAVVAPSLKAPASFGVAPNVLDRFVVFAAAAKDAFRRLCHTAFGEALLREFGDECGVLGVGPGLNFADSDQAGFDQIIVSAGVVADRNDAVHTLGNTNGIHTSNSRIGCHRVSRTGPKEFPRISGNWRFAYPPIW